VFINGENAAEGFGLTPETAALLFESGAAVITSGNHIWQRKELLPLLDSEPRLLRPANYPPGAPGHGSCTVTIRGESVCVINLQGRRRMPDTDCPFRKGRELVRAARKETPLVVVDFHAEATDEKEAMGVYLDGQASAVVGTHTHVRTNDARVLPKGTAYLTDLGSCGPSASVIGFSPDISVRRALTQLPLKNEVSTNPSVLSGAVFTVNTESGKAVSISAIERTVAI
jgi:metallophosphoesterase (TIGR00282 family)